jgi:hypothetical protein
MSMDFSVMVRPVVLNGHGSVRDARVILRDVQGAWDSQAAPRWVVIRSVVRARVVWCALSFQETVTLIAAANDGDGVDEALHLQGRPHVPALQVEVYLRDPEPLYGVLLSGSEVIGFAPSTRKDDEPPSSQVSEPPSRDLLHRIRGARPALARQVERATAPLPAAEPAAVTASPPRSGAVLEAHAGALAEPTRVAARVDVPETAHPGQLISITVGLKSPDDASPQAETFALPGDEPIVPIDIHVVAPDFTSAHNVWRKTLHVPRNAPNEVWSLEIAAPKLAANADSKSTSITVYYSHRGAPLAMAVRQCLITDQATAQDITDVAAGALSTPVDMTATQPIDLTIRIAWLDETETSGVLLWTFESAHALNFPHEPIRKPMLAAASFAQQILSAMTTADGTAGMELALDGLGGTISDQVPQEAFDALRRVWTAVKAQRGAEAIPDVLLLTAETSVPWELALLAPPLDPARPAHLLSQVNVSRWMLNPASAYHTPPATLSVRNLAALFGRYAPGGNWAPLPKALEEAQYLTQHCRAESFEATLDNIVRVLKGQIPDLPPDWPGVQLIHFAGHGEMGRSDAIASTLVMNDGTPIPAMYFRGATVASKARPFIFLNACQVGAAQRALGNYAGFAGMCMHAGFSGVVAPLWSVNDVIACEVAKRFYDAALVAAASGRSPPSVASIFRELRSERTATYKSKDRATNQDRDYSTVTPLAYVVYGHPNLVLTRN